MEVKRNLPSGDRVDTTEAEVVDALHPALQRFAAIVGETEPLRVVTHPVTRQVDDRWEEKDLPLPFHSFDPSDLYGLRDDPEFRRLLDFLWERRVFKKTLIGPEPDRSSWEQWVLWELVQTPCLRSAKSHYLVQLAESGEVQDPSLPDAIVAMAAEVTAKEIVANKKLYRAESILLGAEAEPGTSWSISEEVHLQVLTASEVASFLTRHGANIQTEGALFGGVVLIRIDGGVSTTKLREPRTEERMHGPILDEITMRLDVVKLALMTATDSARPLTEHSVFYTHRLGDPFDGPTLPPYRRQQVFSSPVYHLTDTVLRTASTRFESITRAAANHQGLKGAVWLWGRSATSLLSRDRLLDAVIGMESLLVPKGGSSTYKLGLHGAAALARSDEEAKELFTNLRDLYRHRSSTVHDTPKAGTTKESSQALRLLARLIDRLAILDDKGMLDRSRLVSESIQRQVLTNSRIQKRI